MGPMTGRAAGYCAGYPTPGFMSPIPGRGFGWGRGRGWGRGFGRGRGFGWGAAAPYGWGATSYGYGVPPVAGAPYGGGVPPVAGVPYGGGSPYGYGVPGVTREQELDGLKGQAEYLEDALDGVRKAMQELQAKIEEKK